MIQGKVTDDQGQPIVGASISIQPLDSARKYETKTDKKGQYVYMGIAAGQYRVVARAKGFSPVIYAACKSPDFGARRS